MRMTLFLKIAVGLSIAAAIAAAQRPGGPGGPGPGGQGPGLSKSDDARDLVARMMAFDKNKDGALTKSEVTDERLIRLFDRADADKDGSVTPAELTALGEKEHAEDRGGPPGFGPPGFGPPMGFPGGPPARPGDILSPALRRRLKLNEEQTSKLNALQKEVNAGLDRILNDTQKTQLKELRRRGPGGFGPPGGGPGPNGPGGRPPF